MNQEAIDYRVRDRNRADFREALALIVLGIPFTAIGVFALDLLLFLVLRDFLVSTGIVLGAVLIDTWLHPSEHYVRARYYLVGGGQKGHEFGTLQTERRKGAFSGMPLMTNMSDPENWAMRGKVAANGCANLVLGGPRNIRKGIELIILARRRARPENLSSALLFLKWLRERQPLAEKDVNAHLSNEPRHVPGFMVADELGLISRKWQGQEKILQVSGSL
ncbi:MAG: hypothetical protein HYY16_03925 [Planctomycetes bacterium]|nr:hypothetical protein [Planctomycetota bacterium]